jgi:hypothetical protein
MAVPSAPLAAADPSSADAGLKPATGSIFSTAPVAGDITALNPRDYNIVLGRALFLLFCQI